MHIRKILVAIGFATALGGTVTAFAASASIATEMTGWTPATSSGSGAVTASMGSGWSRVDAGQSAGGFTAGAGEWGPGVPSEDLPGEHFLQALLADPAASVASTPRSASYDLEVAMITAPYLAPYLERELSRAPSPQAEINRLLGNVPDPGVIVSYPPSIWQLFYIYPVADISRPCTRTIGCVWVPGYEATDAAWRLEQQSAGLHAEASSTSLGATAAGQASGPRPASATETVASVVRQDASSAAGAAASAQTVPSSALASASALPVAGPLVQQVASGSVPTPSGGAGGLPVVGGALEPVLSGSVPTLPGPGQPLIGSGGLLGGTVSSLPGGSILLGPLP